MRFRKWGFYWAWIIPFPWSGGSQVTHFVQSNYLRCILKILSKKRKSFYFEQKLTPLPFYPFLRSWRWRKARVIISKHSINVESSDRTCVFTDRYQTSRAIARYTIVFRKQTAQFPASLLGGIWETRNWRSSARAKHRRCPISIASRRLSTPIVHVFLMSFSVFYMNFGCGRSIKILMISLAWTVWMMNIIFCTKWRRGLCYLGLIKLKTNI